MLKNPLLQQAQAKVESGVSDRASYDKIVQALLQTIYDKQIFNQLAPGVINAPDKIKVIADGVVGLLGTLASKARGTMPQQPAVQAAFAVMLDVLDFMEQAGLVKADAALLQQATKDFIEATLPKIGLTPDRLGGALAQVQQVLSNPQQLAAFKASQQGSATPSAPPSAMPQGGA